MEDYNNLQKRTIKIDKVLTLCMRYFSYLAVAGVLFMAIIGTADVIGGKVLNHAIPNTNEWVQYMMIVLLFTLAPYIVLRGDFINVDIFTRKFNTVTKNIIMFFGYLIGAVGFGLAAWKGFDLIQKHISKLTKASPSVPYSLKLWPFTLVYLIGVIFLVLMLLWRCYRTLVFMKKEYYVVLKEFEKSPQSTGKEG